MGAAPPGPPPPWHTFAMWPVGHLDRVSITEGVSGQGSMYGQILSPPPGLALGESNPFAQPVRYVNYSARPG